MSPLLPRILTRGMVLLEAGDLESAEALLREVLELQPRRPYRVWHLLGRLELRRRDGARARESFDRALLLAPRFGPALLGRARAAVLTGELDRALQDLGAAAELPATAGEASLLAAQVLIFLDRELDHLPQFIHGSPRHVYCNLRIVTRRGVGVCDRNPAKWPPALFHRISRAGISVTVGPPID